MGCAPPAVCGPSSLGAMGGSDLDVALGVGGAWAASSGAGGC